MELCQCRYDGKCGSFVSVREKHMAWIMNRNQNADDRSNEDGHANNDLAMLGSLAPCPDDKAHYGKPERI